MGAFTGRISFAKNIVSVPSDTPITTTHTVMKDNDIRRRPVIDRGNLVGIITVRDIREASPSNATTLNIWELTILWWQILVKEVMSKEIRTVSASEAMTIAAKIMVTQKVGGLPFLDKNRKVIGIVTESDDFRMFVESHAKDG